MSAPAVDNSAVDVVDHREVTPNPKNAPQDDNIYHRRLTPAPFSKCQALNGVAVGSRGARVFVLAGVRFCKLQFHEFQSFCFSEAVLPYLGFLPLSSAAPSPPGP